MHRPQPPLNMPGGNLEMLLYDKGVYDQYRAGGTDQDFMDWQNNGRKYAANRGALTNNLEYGESLNPMYGKIMDVISGRSVLKGNPPTINNMDYRPASQRNGESNYGEESGLAMCPEGYEPTTGGTRPGCKRKTTSSQYTSNMNYPSIAESMLVATGAPLRVAPGVTPLPQPKPGVLPKSPVVAPRPRPIGGTTVVAVPVGVGAVPVAGELIKPNVGGGGGGGGGSSEPEKKEDAAREGGAAPTEGFFKKNWMSLLGVIVGGVGAGMYANGAGKSVAMFAVGGAVVGGGVGYGIQAYFNKKNQTPAPAPAGGAAPKSESGCCGA